MTYCGASAAVLGLRRSPAGRCSRQPLQVPSTSRRSRRRGRASCSGLHGLDQLGDDLAAVADDRHVGGAVLADLGRVDVDVDDLGVRGERVAACR